MKKELDFENWKIDFFDTNAQITIRTPDESTTTTVTFKELKDLRSLIDTVLKEERKIGGHTYSKSGKDMCCQPLTEGEGEDLEVKEECKHPNSTKVCNNCGIDWSRVEDKPVQKLPSERIGEIVKQFKTDGAPTDDAILVAIIQYLDEQSKK